MTEDHLQIERHYARLWGEPVDRGRLTKGPLHELPARFEVLLFRRPSGMSVHATRCMSQPGEPERLELHMITRSMDKAHPALVELLTVVAHYHRTGVRLGLGHSVNFGQPWLPGSRCTRGLVSLPYLDGAKLEWLEEPRIRFLWLIPVTDAEIEFKKRHGLEALEARFEEAGFDYADPGRPSVA